MMGQVDISEVPALFSFSFIHYYGKLRGSGEWIWGKVDMRRELGIMKEEETAVEMQCMREYYYYDDYHYY